MNFDQILNKVSSSGILLNIMFTFANVFLFTLMNTVVKQALYSWVENFSIIYTIKHSYRAKIYEQLTTDEKVYYIMKMKSLIKPMWLEIYRLFTLSFTFYIYGFILFPYLLKLYYLR